MSKENVQTIIGRAILEPDFRTLLFTEPAKALEGYKLTTEETTSLKNLDREKFDLAANEVEERISKSGLLPQQAEIKVFSPVDNLDISRLFRH